MLKEAFPANVFADEAKMLASILPEIIRLVMEEQSKNEEAGK